MVKPGRVTILDIPIDALTQSQVLERVSGFIAAGLPNQIATVNPEFIMAAQKNKEFRSTLQQTAINVADGIGTRTAASFLRLQRPEWQPVKTIIALGQGLYIGVCQLFHLSVIKHPLPETITGIDLLHRICQEGQRTGWKIYLLGGKPGVALEAANALTQKYPELHIVGAQEGPPDPAVIPTSASSYSMKSIARDIAASKPDVLFVAFGAPKQDLFIHQYQDELGVPVMMGVGGSFDFIVGRAHRSPVWLQSIGLEWLWRLLVEPNRIGRILTATVLFPWSVFRSILD